MNLEHKNFALEVKHLGDDGTFQGLLSVYDVVDEMGDIVERGAFAKSLVENGGDVPLLWQHDTALPIGRLTLTDGEKGLEAKGRLLLSDDVPQAKTAYALLKAGVVKGMSIGFRIVKKKVEDNLRLLKELRLFEGSLVTIPANRFALVSEVKALAIETKDFDAELEMIRLMDSHYQIMTALRWALSKIIFSRDLKRDEKVEAATETIAQFQRTFLEFLPEYLTAIDESSDSIYMAAELEKKMATAPDRTRDGLKDFCTKLIAHLDGEHSDTRTLPTEAAQAAQAAPPKATEPESKASLHSWFAEYTERWRSEIAGV